MRKNYNYNFLILKNKNFNFNSNKNHHLKLIFLKKYVKKNKKLKKVS